MIMISLFAILLLIAIVGTIAMFRGLRGGRTGDDPHCRRCDYKLHGIDSPHCPECGSALSPANIVLGKRFRRPWTAVAGLLGLLIGLAGGGAFAWVVLPQVDWITYRPTTWLINDLASTSAAKQLNAWIELNRRIGGAGISRHNTDRVVDFCLAIQQQPSVNWAIFDGMAGFTARELLAGRLTDQRGRAFLSKLIRVSLVVRRQTNGTLPYEIVEDSRAPDNPQFWFSEKRLSTNVDGVPIDGPDKGSSSNQLGGNASISNGGELDLISLHIRPGPHTLQIRYRTRIYVGDDINAGDEPRSALMEITTELCAKVLILPYHVEPVFDSRSRAEADVRLGDSQQQWAVAGN